jgi:hypothetical protein
MTDSEHKGTSFHAFADNAFAMNRVIREVRTAVVLAFFRSERECRLAGINPFGTDILLDLTLQVLASGDILYIHENLGVLANLSPEEKTTIIEAQAVLQRNEELVRPVRTNEEQSEQYDVMLANALAFGQEKLKKNGIDFLFSSG